MTYNIRDYGAKGDGVTLDSPAVQLCADLCKEQGGGTIVFPAGQYLCASMRLYSNTRVVLDAGATILISDREADYVGLRGKYDEVYERDANKLIGDHFTDMVDENASFHCGHRLYLQCFRNRTDNLFFIKDAQNVTIEGPGIMDGRQMNFFHDDEYGQNLAAPRWSRLPDDLTFFLPRVFRPHMIVIMDAKNVRLSGFQMLKTALFSVRVLDSFDVFIDHLFIKGDFRCINSDGINIAGSQNVFVDSCSIQNGDDCIAISDAEIQPRKYNTENIIVSNCTFATTHNMARIFCGIDLGPAKSVGIHYPDNAEEIGKTQAVRNIQINNCILLGGATIANIHATHGSIENVRISNITSNHTYQAPSVIMASVGEGTVVRNVRMSGIHAHGHSCMGILGLGGGLIEDIGISDSQFEMDPMTSLFGMGFPDNMCDYILLEYGSFNIHMRHAKKVRFSNVEVKWGKDDLDDLMELKNHDAVLADYYKPLWRPDMDPNYNWPAIYGYDCEDVKLSDMQICAHGEGPATVFENCRNIEE